MGETTYVMRPVAYASIYSVREHPKESVMHAALSQSISFGRFMSESLSWEKWSTFTSKKYVEEAERFAQPGSVAEKKAFFEAHYKRMSGKKEIPASLEVANAAITSSPRNSPRGKLDAIKEQDREETNTKVTKSSVLLDELKAVANKRAKLAFEMKIESPNRFTDTCDDKTEKIGEMELNLNEPKLDIKKNEESSETSVLEETVTEVGESKCQLDNQDSRKMELNEEPESESPCTEYHSCKQDSVSSGEALLGSTKEDDSYSSSPINEKIIVMDSPHKKKSTARWLKPLRVNPSKEFNFFSLTVKKKPNKSKNSAEVAANVASKFRELTPETQTRAMEENCTAISESKNPNGCSPSSAVFTKYWKKCTKKLLFSSFRLRNEEKARRKKEKVEKKQRKWGLAHCFKPSSYRKNHREKIAGSRP